MRGSQPLRRRLVRLAPALFAGGLVTGATVPLSGDGLSIHRVTLLTEGNLFFLGPRDFDHFGQAQVAGDFDGDGADDLATGVPGDDNLGDQFPGSGIVILRYGTTRQGLAPGLASDVLSQAFGSSPDPAEEGDGFGRAMTKGDFNADGFDDLAVGIPFENDADEGGDADSGAVQVYYGSANGIVAASAQYFDEDSPGVPGATDGGDNFGLALATGDFDDDGFDDLAIGVPGENFGAQDTNCGSVNILRGSSVGLDTEGAQRWNQESALIDGSCETDDFWGKALAAADFDGDGFDDLAVGAPGENDGGGVHFLFGSEAGLATAGNNLWTQNDAGVLDIDEPFDQFGGVLAAGDFTGDGYSDLAIGAPLEDLELDGDVVLEDAGAFHIFFGGPTGITSEGSWMWTASSATLEPSETQDAWASALSAGDFDGDGFADLAIGAPGESSLVGGSGSGEVTILRGYSDGVAPWGGQLWNQDSPGVPGASEFLDRFGDALAVGDFDGSGHDDLVVGGPFEDFEAFEDGASWVFYGALFADGFDLGNPGAWSVTSP